jgi:hypothetical protein
MRKMATLLIAGALAASSCGVGFGLGIYWQSRHNADRWNSTALRAQFQAAYLEDDVAGRKPVFDYHVENTTDRDYAVESLSEVRFFVKSKGALDPFLPDAIVIDLPVFIPAHEKGCIAVHFRVMEPGAPNGPTEAEQAFLKHRSRSWNQFDSVVMLDTRNRYRVELPIGTRPAQP